MIYKVEELYYPCSENKGADQLRGYCEKAITAKLICAFVFAYADCWFSHAYAIESSSLIMFKPFNSFVEKMNSSILHYSFIHLHSFHSFVYIHFFHSFIHSIFFIHFIHVSFVNSFLFRSFFCKFIIVLCQLKVTMQVLP